MTKTYTLQEDVLHRLWNTLSYYASTTIYDGERTGGVLAGCPRGEPPTREQIVMPAQWAMHDLQEAIGVAPEQWLRDAVRQDGGCPYCHAGKAPLGTQ